MNSLEQKEVLEEPLNKDFYIHAIQINICKLKVGTLQQYYSFVYPIINFISVSIFNFSIFFQISKLVPNFQIFSKFPIFFPNFQIFLSFSKSFQISKFFKFFHISISFQNFDIPPPKFTILFSKFLIFCPNFQFFQINKFLPNF